VTSQARSFGSAAQRYDRYRPGYAPAAVAWAVGERPRRMVDLGAGTGILSRLLRQLGHDVIAVEPDEQMRVQLVESSPAVTVLGGAAEAIPLADESVDAVVAGQAYHWFDGQRAHPELARVLRPGGVFAALWNDADDRIQWTVRYAEIVDGSSAVTGERPASDFGPWFDPVEQNEFSHDIWMSASDLLAVTTTRSPYLVADVAGRRDMLDAVRQLIADNRLDGADGFAMPHVTRVHRGRRRQVLPIRGAAV
jgi:SAM-dependent methyltransferase